MHMKALKYIVTFFVGTIALSACKPDFKEFEYIQEKSIENLSGQWKGVSVIQKDLDAERKKFPYQTLNITEFMKFNEFTLVLNADKGAPTTFTINYGNSIPLFKFNTGKWEVNNNKQVSAINLINATDTVTLNLSAYSNLKENKATFNYTKSLSGKPVINYELTLTK